MKSKKLLLINGISAIIGFYVIVFASSDKEGGKIFYLISRFVEVPDLRIMVYFTCFILLILAFLAFFLHEEDSKVNKKTYQFLFTASILGFVPFFSYFSCILALVSGVLYLTDYVILSKKDVQESNLCRSSLFIDLLNLTVQAYRWSFNSTNDRTRYQKFCHIFKENYK